MTPDDQAAPNDESRRLLSEAFAAFQQGAKTARWSTYFDLMSDAYCFWYPVPGPYLGKNEGKARAITYFTEVSKDVSVTFKAPYRTAFGRGPDGVSWGVFECEVEGFIGAAPFANRIAVSFDVAGGRLIGHREYIGDMSPFVTPSA